MDTIAARLEQQGPDAAPDGRPGRPRSQDRGWHVRVIPIKDEQVKRAGLTLVFGFGPAVFVLLLACTNVANLLLARFSQRGTEMALRSALGASRSRILRQLLTESALLAAAGGALGIVAAYWGIALARIAVAAFQPRWAESLALDARVLVFAAAVSVVAVVLSGVAPGIYATRTNLAETMKRGGIGRGPYFGMNVNRRPTLVVELALAVPFLVLTGLFARSMANVEQILSSGFDMRNVLAVSVAPSPAKYRTPAQLGRFYAAVRERLAALPGAESTAVGEFLPLPSSGWESGALRGIEAEQASHVAQQSSANVTYVSPGYFETLRFALLQGRTLGPQDAGSAPAAVISREMARRFWGETGAVGRRFRLIGGSAGAAKAWITVVGVVADAGSTAGLRVTRPAAYLAIGDDPPPQLSFLVRSRGDPLAMVEEAKRAVWSVDKDQPLDVAAPVQRLFADELAGGNFIVKVMGAFGWLALLLSATGVYAVANYSVTQRTREFGVRIALGARRADILRLVLGRGLVICAAGVALGSAVAAAITRLVAHELVGVSSADPLTYAATALVLAMAALLASYVPARRATRVDPMVALRYE